MKLPFSFYICQANLANDVNILSVEIVSLLETLVKRILGI